MAQATGHHALTINTVPTPAQLAQWWAAMHADPAEVAVAFSDLMSYDLPTFLASDIWLLLVMDGDTCVAVLWLHDLAYEEGAVVAGWLGGWVAPASRGRTGFRATRQAVAFFQAHGVRHIYSAVNIANRASIKATEGKAMLGFTRVMVYHAFLPFQGVLTDCMIFTMHAADTSQAFAAAARRALRSGTARRVLVSGSQLHQGMTGEERTGGVSLTTR